MFNLKKAIDEVDLAQSKGFADGWYNGFRAGKREGLERSSCPIGEQVTVVTELNAQITRLKDRNTDLNAENENLNHVRNQLLQDVDQLRNNLRGQLQTNATLTAELEKWEAIDDRFEEGFLTGERVHKAEVERLEKIVMENANIVRDAKRILSDIA